MTITSVGVGAEAVGNEFGDLAASWFHRWPVATLAFFEITTTARPPVRHVRAAEGHARPGESTLREHRRARDRTIGGDHDEVVGVVLDADVRNVVTKSCRQCNAAGDDHRVRIDVGLRLTR